MASKKALLRKSRLYVIADKDTCRNIPQVLRKINAAKVNSSFVIQLRDKRAGKGKEILRGAQKLKSLSRKNTVLIINDYPDIAMLAGADGVHIGQEDLPVKAVRKLLGNDKIIGISCHNLRQALVAQKEGADYIGIGPIFSTPTKPEYKAIGTTILKELRKKLRIPFFAIGGIDESNLDEVLKAGAQRIAVCRAVCRTKDVSCAFKRIIKRLRT